MGKLERNEFLEKALVVEKSWEYGEKLVLLTYSHQSRHDVYEMPTEKPLMVFDDFAFEDQYPVIVAYLKQAGYREFIISMKSTDVLHIVHFLLESGAKIEPITLKRRFVLDSYHDQTKGLKVIL